MKMSFERRIKFLTITNGTKVRKPKSGKVKVYTKAEIKAFENQQKRAA